MSAEKKDNSKGHEKIQELHSHREPITQGQPFDEQQRQEKNPDGSQQKDDQ
jgi:hypothetical protein